MDENGRNHVQEQYKGKQEDRGGMIKIDVKVSERHQDVEDGDSELEYTSGIDLNLSLSPSPLQALPPPPPPPPPPPHPLSWLTSPPPLPYPPMLQSLQIIPPSVAPHLPLGPSERLPPPPPPPALLPRSIFTKKGSEVASSSMNGGRKRRLSVREAPNEDHVPPPYPCATDRRACIHTLKYLDKNGMTKISGQVNCKNCESVYEMEVDVQKVQDVGDFLLFHHSNMHNRAPPEWLEPKMMDCSTCGGKGCVRAVVDDDEMRINWLFLLITQSLGYCNLDQLKHFCKHTRIHRTGAKDRLLYVTYVQLLRQLDPVFPFPDPQGV